MDSTATAPGLDLPTNVPLKAYKRARTGATPRASAAGRSALSESELLLYCSAHPKLDYTAREEVSGGADSLLRHYVGVYDPKTGELQVVPARNVVVRGTLRPPPVPEKGDGSSDEEEVPQSVRIHLLLTLYTSTELCKTETQSPHLSRRSLRYKEVPKSYPILDRKRHLHPTKIFPK